MATSSNTRRGTETSRLIHYGCFVLLITSCFHLSTASITNLNLGYLSHDLPMCHLDQQVYHSLLMAVEDVNQHWLHYQMKPSLSLSVSHVHVSQIQNISSIANGMLNSESVLVFGPESSCLPSAYSAAWGQIAISFDCQDESISNKAVFPTTLRTQPPDSQVADAILKLLQTYKLKRISLLVQNTTRWRSFNTTFHRRISSNNQDVSVAQNRVIRSDPSWAYDVFLELKSVSRVFVFLGDSERMRQFLRTIEVVELDQADRYIVVSCDFEPFSQSKAVELLQRDDGHSSRTSPGLVMVSRSSASKELLRFNQRLRSYLNGEALPMSITAAYAYDAVTVYAQALAFIVKDRNLTGEQVAEVARNGQLLFRTITAIQNFSSSARGGVLTFDANGDCRDSFIAVGLSDWFVLENQPAKDFPDSVLIPVGFFTSQSDFHPAFVMNRTKAGRIFCDCLEAESILRGHLNAFLIIIHVLALVGAASVLVRQAGKAATMVNGLVVRNQNSADVDLKDFLSTVHHMEVMNDPGPDEWKSIRTKVWVKTLTYPFRRPILSRHSLSEIHKMRIINHENVIRLKAAVLEPNRVRLIEEYWDSGSLWSLLDDKDVILNDDITASLVMDLVRGMKYLHSTGLRFHGRLKSTNCLVDSSWTLRITGFGLQDLRKASVTHKMDERDYYQELLWTAPEVLRHPGGKESPEGDVYSFSIVLHEIVFRQGPYGIYCGILDAKDIVNQVKRFVPPGSDPYRPPILTEDSYSKPEGTSDVSSYLISAMEDCWAEDPEDRPTFSSIYHYVTKLFHRLGLFLGDVEDLEKLKRTEEKEIQEIDRVLNGIIPSSVASRLADGQPVDPELWEKVTVFEADLVGFTQVASQTTPLGTMILLDKVYTLFDSIARGYDVCKVGTIGDAYIVVSGIDSTREADHAGEIASMALDFVEEMKKAEIRHRGKPLHVRIGIHTGPVVTGVASGPIRPSYSVLGETVTTASLMESTGSELRIQISESSYKELRRIGGYLTEERKDQTALMKTYWLVGRTDKAIQRKEGLMSSTPLCNRQSIISLTSTDIYIDPSPAEE